MNRIHVLSVGLCLSIVLVACGGSDNAGGAKPGAQKGDAAKAAAKPSAPPAMPVTVATPLERDVRDTEELSGRLEAVETVEVKPRVSGYVDSVHFQAGREVRKGDLLFVLDARPFAAELAKMEAELARQVTRAELAKTELARAERLLAVKALSQQEYEQNVATLRDTESSIRAARAQVDATKLNVEFTRVTAPISGRVGRAEVTPGNLVSGGSGAATTLATIVSMDPIYAYFEGDEQSLPKYRALIAAGAKPGAGEASVLMGLASEQGYPRRGRLDFVDNRVDPKTGTIRVRAVFPNPDRALAPGLFARIRLVGSNTYRALLITDRAVGTDQSQKFVLAVGPDNVLQYRPVKLGPLVDGLRVITEGLQAGDRIVVNGLQRVRPGVPVQPQVVTMEAEPKAPDPGAKAAPAPAATDADRKTAGEAKSAEKK